MTAYFGYQNLGGPIEIASQTSGSAGINQVTGALSIQAMPNRFEAGRARGVMKAIFSGDKVVWKLGAAGGSAQSVEASATSARCEQVVPVAECKVTDPNNSVRVTFGYDNQNLFPIHYPVGKDNFLSPAPADRGQPVTFMPGKVGAALSAPFANSENPTWSVGNRSSGPVANLPECLDGTSCNTTSATTIKKSADKKVRALAGAVSRAAKRLVGNAEVDETAARDAERITKKARTLRDKALQVIFSIPDSSASCPILPASCVDIDQEPVLAQVRSLYRQLLRHSSRLYRRIGLSAGVKILPEDRQRQIKNRRVYQDGLNDLKLIPRFIVDCQAR